MIENKKIMGGVDERNRKRERQDTGERVEERRGGSNDRKVER